MRRRYLSHHKGWRIIYADDQHVKVRPKKTDRRYTGHEYFQYFVDLPRSGENGFHLVRNWCWETWGPSKELDEWILDHDTQPVVHGSYMPSTNNPHWCWSKYEGKRRIMFQSREEVALFNLTFGA